MSMTVTSRRVKDAGNSSSATVDRDDGCAAIGPPPAGARPIGALIAAESPRDAALALGAPEVFAVVPEPLVAEGTSGGFGGHPSGPSADPDAAVDPGEFVPTGEVTPTPLASEPGLDPSPFPTGVGGVRGRDEEDDQVESKARGVPVEAEVELRRDDDRVAPESGDDPGGLLEVVPDTVDVPSGAREVLVTGLDTTAPAGAEAVGDGPLREGRADDLPGEGPSSGASDAYEFAGSEADPTSVESPAMGPTSSNPSRHSGTRTSYDYLDAEGVVRYQAVRSPSKQFHLRRPDPEAPGHWVKDIKGVGLVPYRLPDLIAADPVHRVYVSEGEKDCDRLVSLGLVATTNAMGAGNWRDEYNDHLRGRDVVVLADNDDTGRRHVRKVADSLAGVAASVKILELPGLPPKGDVSDWLDAGGTAAELEVLADEVPIEATVSNTSLRYDKTTVLEVARSHFTALAKEFGLEVTSKAPDAKGWRQCRAFDRVDNKPSAGINEETGVYHDFGTNESLSFIALAMRLKPEEFPDEQVVVAYLAERYGVAPLAADPFGGYGGDLPVPRPIHAELAPVPELPPEFLPAPFRGWLEDATERIGCSLEYLAVGAMAALAAVVGRRVTIRPKRLDDWTVVPNLWGGVVGRPGQLKTPALNEANRHLVRLVKEAEDQYTEATEAYEIQKVLAKAQAEAAKDELKKALKANPPDQQKVNDLAAHAAGHNQPDPPIRKRYIVNDTTVEKLGELLGENPNGLLLFRDELTGWLKTLEKPGHEADRAFFLESWNGTGSFTCDRIGRGTVHIAAACLSIMGGIQPGPLAQYLREAARGNGLADDGLISRLQLLVYPDPPGAWTNVDRYPDTEAKNRAFEVFRKLDGLDPVTVGAEAVEKGGPPFLRFAPDAQEFFDAWREDLENNKLRAEHESPLIESHLAKYRSLMPALALLFHLVDVVDGQVNGPVTLQSAKLAAAWCDFLESHVRRIYSASFEGDPEPALRLAERIKSGRVPSPFTVRQVAQNDWSGLNSAEQVERAVGKLEQLNWLRGVEVATGGRPKTEYHINPLVERKGAS